MFKNWKKSYLKVTFWTPLDILTGLLIEQKLAGVACLPGHHTTLPCSMDICCQLLQESEREIPLHLAVKVTRLVASTKDKESTGNPQAGQLSRLASAIAGFPCLLLSELQGITSLFPPASCDPRFQLVHLEQAPLRNENMPIWQDVQSH